MKYAYNIIFKFILSPYSTIMHLQKNEVIQLHKKQNLFIVLIIFLLMLHCSNIQALNIPKDSNSVNLVVDSLNNGFPAKHFRKTSQALETDKFNNLNLTGLSNLNISGSKQFSSTNLPNIIHAIGTNLPITVIDLRQESHGFINEFPVSWANDKNNANAGLSRGEVLLDEAEKLNSIKLNEPLTLYNYPEKTIIPTTVQNEEQLTKANGVSYLRIPVTDGGLPNDAMVDFFINFVKSTPKDTWLHFHCKQGIGRTTTFMIMYDMMKNAKIVPANDIIKRQMLLANFDSQEMNSFSTKSRISFLNEFYNYCKENNESFNVSWQNWKSSEPTISNCGFIKNSKIATNLYVISEDKMSPAERTMVASLQGLVGHCSSQIYIINSSQPDYKLWLEDLKSNYGINFKTISDPFKLVDIFRENIKGYVLYNHKKSNDPSINNACSLASLNCCIAIEDSLETTLKSHGVHNCKGDCRNTDMYWAYNNLWNHGLNHTTVIELSPEKSSPLRDYAVMTKSLIFYEDDINCTKLRDKIFSSMKDNALCLGWGPDEFINVSTASKYGVSIIPADWSLNLSVLSAFPCSQIKQNINLTVPVEKNVHYVSFIMSDGDNQQWELGNNYSSTNWYGSSYRGKFNMGWSISPSLYYLAPTVFNIYYKNAIKDYFIVSPSGLGYIYPSKFCDKKLTTFTKNLDAYMKAVDENYVAIIDDNSLYNSNLFKKYTSNPNIQGLFYLDYHRQDNYHGKIIWSNGKPIVSCRDLLWKDIEDEETLINNIKTRANNGNTDITNPSSYTLVYVHAWSKNMNDIYQVVNKLQENKNIKIVCPKIFMELIKRNIKH